MLRALNLTKDASFLHQAMVFFECVRWTNGDILSENNALEC